MYIYIHICIYIYIYMYTYIKKQTFISQGVIFWFLWDLRRLNLWLGLGQFESSKAWKKPKYYLLRNKCLIFDIYWHFCTWHTKFIYIYILYIYIYICIYIYIYICRTCILMQDMFKNNLQQFIVCRNHFSEIWKYNRFEIFFETVFANQF